MDRLDVDSIDCLQILVFLLLKVDRVLSGFLIFFASLMFRGVVVELSI